MKLNKPLAPRRRADQVNLELLRTFYVAAGVPTFGEAAQRRGVSVSAVSQQIKALEQQLGARLFERLGRRVQLSAEGRALFDQTRAPLRAVEEAVERLGDAAGQVSGLVRVGSPRTFWSAQLFSAVAPLLERWTGLRLEVRFDVPSVLERRLVEGELDLAILARPPDLPGIDAAPFATETFVAVASPRYLSRHGRPRSEAEFASHRFIVFDGDRPMHVTWWRAAFGRRSEPSGQTACAIASLEQMAALADAGLGLTVIPSYLLPQWKRLQVLTPEPAGRPARNTLFWCRRVGAIETARVSAVRTALADRAALQ